MMSKSRGEHVCVCDECGHEEYGGVEEWAEFWARLKREGWKARKDGDVWSHACPDCQS